MFTPVVILDLALSKARERKLLEQAAIARLLKQTGSDVRRFRPSTLTLFGLLLTKRI